MLWSVPNTSICKRSASWDDLRAARKFPFDMKIPPIQVCTRAKALDVVVRLMTSHLLFVSFTSHFLWLNVYSNIVEMRYMLQEHYQDQYSSHEPHQFLSIRIPNVHTYTKY
jgi:hypothetical protein